MQALRRTLRPLEKTIQPSLQYVRHFAADKKAAAKEDEDSQPKYFQGRRIVEEVIDEFKHEHMLLSITGYDAAVLDSYVKFVRNAAQMTEVDLTKSFRLGAVHENFSVRKSASQLRKDQMVYHLKKHQRHIEISEVTEDKVDIFLDYIQDKIPCGVQINVELKRWEELVAPNHPSLQKGEKSVSRYQK
eukprot:Seg505.4 transcript_id=Seg505.4/GoldUCD/mRNA.D3Y31 product="putative 28S ribosomal protein S10 mitochondrial" pseudo=true protein_id=Seg505.4/GoldUCD/D3Y31